MVKTLKIFGLSLMAMVNLGLIACGSDEDDDNGIDTSPITLLAGNEKIILGADTIVSSDKFVAYSTKNTVHGWHVGKTSLLVNGKATISLEVLGLYNLYDDPICEWGCSMEYVKKMQKQGTLSSKSNDETLIYENAGGASAMAYHFEGGKLSSVLAMVSTNHTATLGKYMAERYLMTTMYEGKETYYVGMDAIDSSHARTYVMMDLYNTNTWSVFYTKFPEDSARSRSNIDGKRQRIMMQSSENS